ncbi:MAG: D-alanyl-D-alanine carboxypeptidase [Salaquimonas sp.]
MASRFLVFVFILFALPTIVFAGAKERVAALAPKGMVFVMDKNGNELIAQNSDKKFVPASVAKTVTAWLAMETLGGDYHFKTQFYLSKDRVLYVRGGGDPFLISEELAILAPQLLAVTGKEAFSGMVIDASYYPKDLQIPGIEKDDESYNALNTALAVNFNTIHARRKGKTVTSAEKQTPITPMAISQFRKRGPNGRGRISLAQEDPAISLIYAGELIAAFISKEGGEVKGRIIVGSVPDGLEPVYVHEQSRPLSDLLTQMLLGSNNYMANQIFLEVGARQLGGSVSLEKSLKVANDLLAKNGLGDAIELEEGSGISSGNQFTPRGLAKVLDLFENNAELLKKTKAGSRYKTGTLSTVSTLAGYAETKKNGRVRFVIALPGRTGKLRFRILSLLEKEL